ncbi:reverse transcriptase domain-containing protein [Trichonephila clavipes]|nr:reverse transcriptase domain-containing protein [Trichonephila clavipes]
MELEKVVRDSNINARGNIFNKSMQLLAFANDIDIIARTPTALRQAFLPLEKETLRMGLKINENKTKYMPYTKSCFNISHYKIDEYSFEVVDSFTYLGSEINNRNGCTTEIQKKITMGDEEKIPGSRELEESPKERRTGDWSEKEGKTMDAGGV